MPNKIRSLSYDKATDDQTRAEDLADDPDLDPTEPLAWMSWLVRVHFEGRDAEWRVGIEVDGRDADWDGVGDEVDQGGDAFLDLAEEIFRAIYETPEYKARVAE